MLKAIKHATDTIIFFLYISTLFPLSVYLQAFLTWKNLLAKLKLQYAHLLKFLVKNAKFVKRILNPSFIFKFYLISVFSQTTKI